MSADRINHHGLLTNSWEP